MAHTFPQRRRWPYILKSQLIIIIIIINIIIIIKKGQQYGEHR